MALQGQSIREQRHDQIYPTLDPLEIEQMHRFGNLRSFAAGESLWTAAQIAPGLIDLAPCCYPAIWDRRTDYPWSRRER